MTEKSVKNDNLNNDFNKILLDFCKDLLNTFPEIHNNMNEDLLKVLNGDNNSFTNVYTYCKQVFPERFFDILYQNADIFTDDNINTCFLPGIDFKQLWICDITDMTRETIWKYLQLLLFSIVNDLSDGESFGDTAKIFEAINETEFKHKLDETINNIKEMFETNETKFSDCSGINLEDLPDAKQFHDHINNMMNGKLGNLAREIAEETANELNIDSSNVTSANDYFQTLLKNPKKMMDLVKNVGDKLDTKIKSGEIKESELIEEAGNIIKRMRDIPEIKNIQTILRNMGIPNQGRNNAKVDVGAIQNILNQNLIIAKNKERMKRKIVDNKTNSKSMDSTLSQEELEREATITRLLNEGNSNDIENLIFKTGDKMKKSMRTREQNNIKQHNLNDNNKFKKK